MVNDGIVPYLPSSRWAAVWMRLIHEGAAPEEAVSAANICCGIEGKDFTRGRILSPRKEEILLSAPVEGGNAMLRRRGKLAQAMLSDHGNWRHTHLGALEASYGRTPFYPHLMPMLRDAILADDHSLSGFNSNVFGILADFLSLGLLSCPLPPAASERGMELSLQISPSVSVVDAAMRLGPDATLALACMSGLPITKPQSSL